MDDDERIRQLLRRGLGDAPPDDGRAQRVVAYANKRRHHRRFREVMLTGALAVALIAGLTLTMVMRERSTQPPPKVGTTLPAIVTSTPTISLSATPSPTPSPPPPPPPVAVVYAMYLNASGVNTQLHEATVHDGVATDRVLSADHDIALLDVGHAVALVAVVSGNTLPDKLATVDLQSGALHIVSAGVPVDAGYGFSQALSPDGTQAAVGRFNADGSITTLIVTLGSGNYRYLHILGGPPNAEVAGWTSTGVLVEPERHDSDPVGLWRVDPQSGNAIQLYRGEVSARSRDATVVVDAAALQLGDGPCPCAGPWKNSLSVTRLGGAPTQIVAEKNRNFVPDDVTNGGAVLFTSEDGGGVAPSHASDAGLYLADGGSPVQQFHEQQIEQWGGRLLSSDEAIVSQIHGNTIEIDLAKLCTGAIAGCQASTSRISSATGDVNAHAIVMVVPT